MSFGSEPVYRFWYRSKRFSGEDLQVLTLLLFSFFKGFLSDIIIYYNFIKMFTYVIIALSFLALVHIKRHSNFIELIKISL